MEVKRQYLAVKYAKALYKSLSNRTDDKEDHTYVSRAIIVSFTTMGKLLQRWKYCISWR